MAPQKQEHRFGSNIGTDISVSDDGVGTVESFADAKPGLGSSIVEALAHQLDASVTTQEGEPGITVVISSTDDTEEKLKASKTADAIGRKSKGRVNGRAKSSKSAQRSGLGTRQ